MDSAEPVKRNTQSASDAPIGPLKEKRFKPIVAVILFVAVSCITLVGLVGYYFSGSSMKHINNGGFTYSFMFSNASYIRRIDSVNYLYGYSKTSTENMVVMAKPTNDLFLGDCQALGAGYELAFMARGAYPSYAVCDNDHRTYEALVTKIDGSHMVELFSANGKSQIGLGTAESVFDSLTIAGK